MKINVMVNGLNGKMATAVAQKVVSETSLELVPYSLTGPETGNDFFAFYIDEGEYSKKEPSKEVEVLCVPPNEREKTALLLDQYRPFVAVDFTLPQAVNENAKFYCENSIPFVMGTTGGDRELLEETVRSSKTISAVIGVNMAAQIVGFQAMMEYAAKNFPGLFSGYEVFVMESHQSNKADTSGTAKDIQEKIGILTNRELSKKPVETRCVGDIKSCLGYIEEGVINKIRRPSDQILMGVPVEHLSGHGWHSYALVSSDENIMFQFTHNVNGRAIYAQGAIDAVRFLIKRLNKEKKGKVFSMIDVLKG